MPDSFVQILHASQSFSSYSFCPNFHPLFAVKWLSDANELKWLVACTGWVRLVTMVGQTKCKRPRDHGGLLVKPTSVMGSCQNLLIATLHKINHLIYRYAFKHFKYVSLILKASGKNCKLHLKPSSDAVLNVSRVECKWKKPLFFLIRIRFGSCGVRLLNCWA